MSAEIERDLMLAQLKKVQKIVKETLGSPVSDHAKFFMLANIVMSALHAVKHATLQVQSPDAFSTILGDCLENIGVYNWKQPSRVVH